MPKLARLEDLQMLRVKAMRGGFTTLDNPEWSIDRIVRIIARQAEKLGFNPEDPQLLHELQHHAESGARARCIIEAHRAKTA